MTSLKAFALRAGVAGIALVAAAPFAAQAADLPSRVITPVAPVLLQPAYSWTGFYVGGSVGGDFVSNHTSTNALATGFAVDQTSAQAGFSDQRVRLGGYLGYNYQISQVVIGVEGDGAYDFGHSRSITGVPGTIAFVGQPNNDLTTAGASHYDASARGRLGFTLTPGLLLYVTGGVAFRDNSLTISCPGTGNSWCSQNEFGKAGGTRAGYTVGGGVETVVFRNLVARLEYRYSDFGTRNLNFFGPPDGPSGDYFGISQRVSASTVTAGLAYKFDFGAPLAPVVARY